MYNKLANDYLQHRDHKYKYKYRSKNGRWVYIYDESSNNKKKTKDQILKEIDEKVKKESEKHRQEFLNKNSKSQDEVIKENLERYSEHVEGSKEAQINFVKDIPKILGEAIVNRGKVFIDKLLGKK